MSLLIIEHQRPALLQETVFKVTETQINLNLFLFLHVSQIKCAIRSVTLYWTPT